MGVFNPQFKLYESKFIAEEHSEANHLSRALLTEGSWLSNLVTHLYGSNSQYGSFNFPILWRTEGQKNIKLIESVDGEFKQPVIGRPKKTSTVISSKYAASDKVGVGHSVFYLVFEDKWFQKGQIILSNRKKPVQVISIERNPNGQGFIAECRLATSSKSSYLSSREFKAGAVFAQGPRKVSFSRSRGGEHRSYTPYSLRNQISLLRDTMKFAGNVKNKVMNIEIQVDGKSYVYWTQFEMYLNDLMWMEACEDDLFYSEFNKDEDGIIHNIDPDSGEVVPSGAGLLQQIDNEDSYSIMTEKKIKTFIRDVFFNTSEQADNGIADIEVITGTGGSEEAHTALMTSVQAMGFTASNIGDKFVKGEGNNLEYGAYFNTYRHKDGHRITFRQTPMMDRGSAAQASEPHPITGLPLESYNMYAIDMSSYDGQSNLQYVQEKGRQNVEFAVAGASVPEGYEETVFRASDIDACSIERMKTHGVHITRPTNCFKMNCNIS